MEANGNNDARSEMAARYRRAAEVALDQLEWCVGYLRRIRKDDIANALERNGAHIRRRLSGADE